MIKYRNHENWAKVLLCSCLILIIICDSFLRRGPILFTGFIFCRFFFFWNFHRFSMNLYIYVRNKWNDLWSRNIKQIQQTILWHSIDIRRHETKTILLMGAATSHRLPQKKKTLDRYYSVNPAHFTSACMQNWIFFY